MSFSSYKPSSPPELPPVLAAYLKEEFNKVRKAFIFNGDRQQVTPVWTGATTDPAIGNGTITGWYRRIQDMVFFSGRITVGSTTTFGSGWWHFAPPAELALPATGYWHGAARAIDSGASPPYFTGVTRIDNGQSSLSIFSDAEAGAWADTRPFTWAQNDEIEWTVAYKV